MELKNGHKSNLKCSKCGAELDKYQTFCSKCGQKVPIRLDSATDKVKDKVANAMPIFKNFIKILVIVVILIIIIKTLVGSKSKKYEESLNLGDYVTAYELADEDEKENLLIENEIAYICESLIDSLKSSKSFYLKNVYYNSEQYRYVMVYEASNALGGTVTNYAYYTFDEDENEYSLYVNLSSLEEETYYKSDTTYELAEKMLTNAAREVVIEMMDDKSMKVDSSIIDNINTLFKNGNLTDIELIEENNFKNISDSADT